MREAAGDLGRKAIALVVLLVAAFVLFKVVIGRRRGPGMDHRGGHRHRRRSCGRSASSDAARWDNPVVAYIVLILFCGLSAGIVAKITRQRLLDLVR